MITRLTLIRHAETNMNANYPHIIGGRSNDTPLTPKGRLQAEKLGMRFMIEQPDFTAVYTSPSVRTIDTMCIAHRIWGKSVAPIKDKRLQEISQGDWEGGLRSQHHTPEMLDIIRASKGTHRAPNGENQPDVEKRMMEFAENCVEQYVGGHVAVYSHGIAIKCLARAVQKSDRAQTYYTAIENTSLTIIDYLHDEKIWRWHSLNDHAHLSLV